MKPVKAVLNLGEPTSYDWCDFPASVCLIADLTDDDDRRELLKLIHAAFKALENDGGMFEHTLRGRMYMTGRLPEDATFKPNGDPCPNVVIVDDIHGYTFPKKRTSPKRSDTK